MGQKSCPNQKFQTDGQTDRQFWESSSTEVENKMKTNKEWEHVIGVEKGYEAINPCHKKTCPSPKTLQIDMKNDSSKVDDPLWIVAGKNGKYLLTFLPSIDVTNPVSHLNPVTYSYRSDKVRCTNNIFLFCY